LLKQLIIPILESGQSQKYEKMNNLNYGIIGNCRTAALISTTGAIDWCCLPDFNSSSVFAAILDENRGGCFGFEPDGTYEITQKYIRNTNILVTLFNNSTDAFEVIDFMPRYYMKTRDEIYCPPDIIRYIRVIKGKPQVRFNYDPKLEYGLHNSITTLNDGYIKSTTQKGTYDSLYLYSNIELKKILKREYVELSGESYFLISYNQKILKQNIDRIKLKYERTKVYWLVWSERTTEYNEYSETIIRSALTLKILSYEKTGAVLAAATTSLPETIGEIRNWDYRFCWIRDASMVVRVMFSLGHINMAHNYMSFIIKVVSDKDDKIQIMYGINGEKRLTESVLTHFSGYQGSAPVRIGNDAYRQKQHDIYGFLMDVIYQQFSKYETSLQNSEELWTITRGIARSVERNWRKPDRGIWEIRTGQRHFTFSKVLCWVAIDRAIKVARLIGQHESLKAWTKLRDTIRTDIEKNAWNDEVQAYTQHYETTEMDASTLLMEQYGYIEADNPRYISTVHRIEKELMRNGLLYRYKNRDDFGVPSSAFTICTLWLINSLVKIGQKERAKKMFDTLLGYGNHLGLFSEDIDFTTKRLLGNFPQAYSHLAIIEAAILLQNNGFAIE
jgi:alpha,alpha-trehalase